MRFLGFLAISALTLACGSSDNPGGKDGGDGSVPTDGSGMDGSGNPEAGTDGNGGGDGAGDGSGGDGGGGGDASGDAGCLGTWTSCATCLTTNCATELTACNANNACKNGFAALAACETMCGMNCIQTFEATGQEAQDLSDCGQNNCSVCGW